MMGGGGVLCYGEGVVGPPLPLQRARLVEKERIAVGGLPGRQRTEGGKPPPGLTDALAGLGVCVGGVPVPKCPAAELLEPELGDASFSALASKEVWRRPNVPWILLCLGSISPPPG